MSSARAKEWGRVRVRVKVRALERASRIEDQTEGDFQLIALHCGNLPNILFTQTRAHRKKSTL